MEGVVSLLPSRGTQKIKAMKSIRETIKGIKKNSITPPEVKEVAVIMLMILNSKKRSFYYSEIQSFADKYKQYSLYVK